jgi:excisionase family DNA binding protein
MPNNLRQNLKSGSASIEQVKIGSPQAAGFRTAHSVDDICKAINASRSFLYCEIRRGRLKAHKVGRATRVLDSDFQDYLASWKLIEPRELVAA